MEDLLQGSSCIFQRTSLDAVRSADENERVRALVSNTGFSFQALGPGLMYWTSLSLHFLVYEMG